MKRSHFYIVGIIAAGAIIPTVALAQFSGAPKTAPPSGNVPGVIWNTKGTSVIQDAEMNITGSAQLGTVTLTQTPSVNFFDNPKLESGKAFHVDSPIDANFFMGNWGGPGGTGNALTFNIAGGLSVDRIGPGMSSLGKDGRVQARKFCFTPGGVTDCITSWPSGGGGGGSTGSFVSKVGDSMSGTLTISSATGGTFGIDASAPAGSIFRNGGTSVGVAGTFNALDVQQSGTGAAIKVLTSNTAANGVDIIPIFGSTGVALKIGTITGYEAKKGLESYSDGHAVYGSSLNNIGGEFVGEVSGVDAKTRTAGTGSAVHGSNGAIGGEFTGVNYGVYSIGGFGSLFYDNSLATYAYVAYPGYGLYTNSQVYTSNNMTAGGSLSVTGDADITGNTWGSSASSDFNTKYGSSWPNLGPTLGGHANKCGSFTSAGDTFGATGWVMCPDGTYLAGLKKSSEKITNFMCCEL